MNTVEKMTDKVNKVNEKVDAINKKISVVPLKDIPKVKAPSRKAQKTGAIVSGVVSILILLIGVFYLNNIFLGLLGFIGTIGALLSYRDSNKK